MTEQGALNASLPERHHLLRLPAHAHKAAAAGGRRALPAPPPGSSLNPTAVFASG